MPDRNNPRRGKGALLFAGSLAVAVGALVFLAATQVSKRSRPAVDNEETSPRECEPADARERRIAIETVRAKVFPQLYGPSRLQPGPLFSGVVFGSPVPDDTRVRLAKLADDANITVAYSPEAGPLDTLDVTLATIDMTDPGTCLPVPDDPCSCAGSRNTGRYECEGLLRNLEAAWGPGDVGREATVWVDTSKRRRVSVTHDYRCAITFAPLIDVIHWIQRTGPAVVRMDLIGKPANQLPGYDGSAQFRWDAPPPLTGTERTHLGADVENGKVVGLRVEVRATPTTITAVRARLETLLGKPVRGPSQMIDDGEDDGRLEWRGKPHVTFDAGDGLFMIGIGAAANDL